MKEYTQLLTAVNIKLGIFFKTCLIYYDLFSFGVDKGFLMLKNSIIIVFAEKSSQMIKMMTIILDIIRYFCCEDQSFFVPLFAASIYQLGMYLFGYFYLLYLVPNTKSQKPQ